ncbi:MAG: hypothetical protein R2752_18745 [Vicinamibacterales bacterium]
MRRVVLGLMAVVAAGLGAGCIEVEQSLGLERDLSGTAGVVMRVNLEPMAAFMARMQREMSGKTGEPTPEEIEKARAEMLSSSTRTTPQDFEADKRELERNLPTGVKLLGADFEEEGLRFGFRLSLAFDKVESLRAIKLPQKKDAGPAGPGNPVESPFKDLVVRDDGDEVVVEFPLQNPMSGDGKGFGPLPDDADTAKQVQQMFSGLRVGFRITTPFTVVDSTAHRQEGQTLVWDYDLKKMLALTPKAQKAGIRARFKK